MENRIAIIGIFVYSKESVEKLNDLLHSYSRYIVGRMGLPYREKHLSVISIIVDAENDIIGALAGKIGALPHINTKTIYAKPQRTTDNESI